MSFVAIYTGYMLETLESGSRESGTESLETFPGLLSSSGVDSAPLPVCYLLELTRLLEPYPWELHVGSANGFMEKGDDTKLLIPVQKYKNIIHHASSTLHQ